MAPKKSKVKVEVEPDDEFMKMDSNQLQAGLALFKEKYSEIKAKRNYIQMDRDMVEQFYKNTNDEVSQILVNITNQETQMQQCEEEHQVEVKVYLQKVKHLEYEQEKKNIEIEKGFLQFESNLDGQGAQFLENDYFSKRLKDMMGLKADLKKQLVDKEHENQKDVDKLNYNNNRILNIQKREFDSRIKERINKYEERSQNLRAELELKLKVEMHELEERKNLHINELINNHEKAFKELKKYYNEITAENLNLIKAQKDEISRINTNLNINTKLIADMKTENDALRGPLQKKRNERDDLRNKLKQFPKHKMSLQNLKCKLAVLKEKNTKLKSQRNDLDQKFEQVQKEKHGLEIKFEQIVDEVKRHSELENIVLTERLYNFENQLQNKEAQLEQVIQQSNLNPALYGELQGKIKNSIETKNQLISNLKYSINHATKAYNDAIRVYEAKLVQFGIPPDELGFQLLDTQTSTMPAGLVSS